MANKSIQGEVPKCLSNNLAGIPKTNGGTMAVNIVCHISFLLMVRMLSSDLNRHALRRYSKKDDYRIRVH